MEQPQSSGLEWVRGASGGDPESLHHLAEAVHRRIHPYIGRIVLDMDLRADLTQETLVRVLGSLGRLRDARRFWPWVYTIAANATRQHLRCRRRRREVLFSAMREGWLAERACGDTRDGLPAGVLLEEKRALTRTALSRIQGRYRDVLLMRFAEGRSYGEVAESLGCAPVTARSLLHRAKKALRRRLTEISENADFK